MKPFSLPASTVNAVLAGALTTVVVWAIQMWGHVTVPVEVTGAITTIATVIAAHFTTDAPTDTPPAQ